MGCNVARSEQQNAEYGNDRCGYAECAVHSVRLRSAVDECLYINKRHAYQLKTVSMQSPYCVHYQTLLIRIKLCRINKQPNDKHCRIKPASFSLSLSSQYYIEGNPQARHQVDAICGTKQCTIFGTGMHLRSDQQNDNAHSIL